MKTIGNVLTIYCETILPSKFICSRVTKTIKDIPLEDYMVVLKLFAKLLYIDRKVNKKTNTESLPFLGKTTRRTKRLEKLIEDRNECPYVLERNLKEENTVCVSDNVIQYIKTGRKVYDHKKNC
jgi:hypothetical protein